MLRFAPRGTCVIALTSLVAMSAGQAQSANAGTRPVRLKSLTAVMEQMPTGDHATVLPKVQEAPRLLPMGDAKAKALLQRGIGERNATPGGAPGTLIDSGSAPTSRTLTGKRCDTNVATGFAPSDIHGAVGPSYMVVVTNVDIGIYNRTNCALISRVSLKSFFNVTDAARTLFDPRVIYDKRVNRFFVTVESRQSSGNDQYQYFAVSTNSKGTAWYKYNPITLSQGSSFFCKSAASSFWDYPNVGVNLWRWFITANDFGASTRASILMINKAPTLTGQTTNIWCWGPGNNVQSNLAPPIVLDNDTWATFLSPGSGSGAAVARWDIVVDTAGNGGTDTLNLRSAYPITSWTGSTGAWQPNSGFQRLDGLDGRFQSASIQSRLKIWNVHTIGVSGFARVRLYQFSNASTSSPAPSLVFTPITTTSDDLINPSVSTGSGLPGAPIFMTATRTMYNNVSSGKAAQLVFSGLNNSADGSDWRYDVIYQSAGTFSTADGVTSCNTSSRGSCRWGDYSSTQVDPLALGRAWSWNQNIPGTADTNQFNWITNARPVEVNLPYGPETQ